jgi:hypothetical protein
MLLPHREEADMQKLLSIGALLAASALGLWQPQPAMANGRVVIVYSHHHHYRYHHRRGYYYRH